MRRVVVTGLGMVTPLGSGVDSNWRRLINSESGLRSIQSFDVSDLPAKIAGQVPRGETASGAFNADDWVPPKDQRKMDEFIIFAVAAATQAVEDSGWKPTAEEDCERTGVMIGSGIGGLQAIYDASLVLKEKGPRRISPFFIPSALINLASGHVSIKYGFKGPNHAVVTACSTGAHAIGDAGRLIQLGDADVMVAGGAEAQVPRPWQLGMQEPGSVVKERIHDFHNLLLWIITAITIFVLALLIYVMVRFRASANPTPTRTTHNTMIEIVWTVVPIVILVVIAIPSFKLLYFEDKTPNPDMTLKVTGHQWYWSYEYADQGNLQFDSYIIQESDLKPGQLRLLEVDNRVVLPVDTNVRILVAGTDVMHSWMISSLGVQIYAVPGRVNETWVRIDKPGVYYGQCNQICGTNHAYMPIAVEGVSKEDFKKWVEDAKKKFASLPADQQPVRGRTRLRGAHTRPAEEHIDAVELVGRNQLRDVLLAMDGPGQNQH